MSNESMVREDVTITVGRVWYFGVKRFFHGESRTRFKSIPCPFTGPEMFQDISFSRNGTSVTSFEIVDLDQQRGGQARCLTEGFAFKFRVTPEGSWSKCRDLNAGLFQVGDTIRLTHCYNPEAGQPNFGKFVGQATCVSKNWRKIVAQVSSD